jgi:hypothetical protein
LPFLGPLSIQLRDRMLSLYKHMPAVKLRLIFVSSSRIGHAFRFKDRVPLSMRSGVVYRYKCSVCNNTYVGKTTRRLHSRVAEHSGISERTEARTHAIRSAVYDHSLECQTRISLSDFSVLCSAGTDRQLLIKESLSIRNSNPVLNAQLSSYPLYLLLTCGVFYALFLLTSECKFFLVVFEIYCASCDLFSGSF